MPNGQPGQYSVPAEGFDGAPPIDTDALTKWLADVYQRIQYGQIPMPGDVPLPAPAAPQTEHDLTNWTPDQMYAVTAEKLAAWAQATRDAIRAAEASGSYTPKGVLNLGLDAQTLGYLLAGGAVLVGVIAISFVLRR